MYIYHIEALTRPRLLKELMRNKEEKRINA